MLKTDTKFYVTSWDTGEVLETFDTLAPAKKDCKKRGCVRIELGINKGVMPIAYVAADYIDPQDGTEYRGCVYNPRFK